MKTRLLAFVALGAISGAAFLVLNEGRAGGPEDDMASTAPLSSNAPLIDRNLPARIESATFALG